MDFTLHIPVQIGPIPAKLNELKTVHQGCSPRHSIPFVPRGNPVNPANREDQKFRRMREHQDTLKAELEAMQSMGTEHRRFKDMSEFNTYWMKSDDLSASLIGSGGEGSVYEVQRRKTSPCSETLETQKYCYTPTH